MKKLLRVDMTTAEVKLEDLPAHCEGLGGRALSSTIINDEVPPECAPLGARNKLVLAPGLLSGTGSPCSGRLSVGAKSPLTGGIKEANVGGTASPKIARLGIAAIVVEGQPSPGKTYILKVAKDGCSVEEAADLAGCGNYDVCTKLLKKCGDKVSIISIGQAGEMLLAGSSVAVSDMEGMPNRHAGRGGMGAVMGSKGLKAVVVDDAGTEVIRAKNSEDFTSAAREFAKELREGGGFPEQLRTCGTPGGIPTFNAFGTLPTRNFGAGTFEHADKIEGMTIVGIAKERGAKMHGCTPSCPIRCSINYHDKDNNFVVGGFEYETVAMLGSNLLIHDLDAIAEMNRLLNDYGLDTIEVGAAIGVAMEAGEIEFGDSDGAIRIIKEISEGTIRGRMIGSGVVVTGKVLGVKHVPAVKGQSLPAHHPQSNKMVGVTYCTSPMGADHTAGITYDPDIGNPEGKVKQSLSIQIPVALIDSLGMCMFAGGVADYVPRLMSALNGSEVTYADLEKVGRHTLRAELDFNRRAGLTKAHDRLPESMTEIGIKPHDHVFDVPYEEVDAIFEGL
jgi:aldehyde:ferredoxin oxidoreductase